jgi:hypothetical protein
MKQPAASVRFLMKFIFALHIARWVMLLCLCALIFSLGWHFSTASAQDAPPTLTPLPTFTLTPSPAPTQSLITPTPAFNFGAPPEYVHPPAASSASEGWSCGDFPCEDDIEGWLQRIQVPPRYAVQHVGRFPGNPMQIVYGADGQLYATVLENGTRNGAVYVMNADGTTERRSDTLISPLGLAFQPGTDILYVSARLTPTSGGALYRVLPDGTTDLVIESLPCCYMLIDNQPNGIAFGGDGYLYIGVGSLTDHAEPPENSLQRFVTLTPNEAAILRIQPHTGEITTYATGIRNPFDLAFDQSGIMYATDNGLVTGEGDRVLRVLAGENFGFPYWRNRGCETCEFTPGNITIAPDLWTFPPYTLPRGITVYLGAGYPTNLFGSVFVALWNGVEHGQRIVRIDPRAIPSNASQPQAGLTPPPWATVTPEPPPNPEPFVTGLIRPIDVTISPEGWLVVVDFVYGHVWRVVYPSVS